MTKEDDMIAKIRVSLANLSPKDEEKIRATFKEIKNDPNICSDCWSGGAYLDGKLICDCWPNEELYAFKAGIHAGTIECREEGAVTHYATKRI